MAFKGVNYRVDAYALQDDTLLANVATDVNHRYMSRIVLPALLSGASSVSADPEGDFLLKPGSIDRPSLIDTTDSLTPPALLKEPMAWISDYIYHYLARQSQLVSIF